MYKILCLSLIFSPLIILSGCGFEPMAAQSTKSYDQKQMPTTLTGIAVRTNTQPNQRMIGETFRIAEVLA